MFSTKNTKEFNYYDLTADKSNILKVKDIGSKAKGLIELKKLNLNIPKAMCFDAKTCMSYLNNKSYFNQEFFKIDSCFKDYLKDSDSTPILVSVRSGAAISMPGMMDTILNVGIDDTSYNGLVKKYGLEVMNECAIKFMESFCVSVLGMKISLNKNLFKSLKEFKKILEKNSIFYNKENIFPLELENQIYYSVCAVFDSWNSERATSWRKEKNIDYDIGTGCIIQKMVLGNKNNDSLTAVIFSRDPLSGKSGMVGEYIVKAQGEDLVGGIANPLSIQHLKKENKSLYEEIEKIAILLEKKYKHIQEIEITVEDNQVYVLQKRNAVLSLNAQINFCEDLKLPIEKHISIDNFSTKKEVASIKKADYVGLSASDGVISGIAVKTLLDIEKYKGNKLDLIFISKEALPSHGPMMLKTKGFITEVGGVTSHAAVLARSLNKPCVVGVGNLNIKSGDYVTIDGNKGYVWKDNLSVIENHDELTLVSKKILQGYHINEMKDAFTKVKLESWFGKIGVKKHDYKDFMCLFQKLALLVIKNNQQNKKLTF